MVHGRAGHLDVLLFPLLFPGGLAGMAQLEVLAERRPKQKAIAPADFPRLPSLMARPDIDSTAWCTTPGRSFSVVRRGRLLPHRVPQGAILQEEADGTPGGAVQGLVEYVRPRRAETLEGCRATGHPPGIAHGVAQGPPRALPQCPRHGAGLRQA